MDKKELEQLIKSYGSSIDPKISERLTNLYQLNKKYTLSEGTQDDFNNVTRFLISSQLKNSKLIDSGESDLSTLFGSTLLDYYHTYVNNEELAQLTSKIINYNTKITNIYTVNENNDKESISSIMSNIYGIDFDTFEISENSYAYKLLETLKENYKTYYNKPSNYSFSSYEQEFLIMATYDFIFTKVSKSTGLSLNTENNRIKIDYLRDINNDQVLYTNPQDQNEDDIISKYYNKNISVINNGLGVYKSIRVGNIQDPYSYKANETASVFTGINAIKTLINGQEVDSLLNIGPAMTHINTNETNYYVYDIKHILELYDASDTEIESIGFLKVNKNNEAVPVFDAANYQSHIIYTNEIYDVYKSYFNTKNEYDGELSKVGDAKVTHNANQDYGLFKSLFDNVNNSGDFEKELQVMINTFKILYDFNPVDSSARIGNTYNGFLELEKRSASSLESYYTLKFTNLNYMTFTNILVDIDSDLYKNLRILFYQANCYKTSDLTPYGFNDYITANGKKYAMLSFSIIYKEFNENIRRIDLSDIQNHMIGLYLSSADPRSFINERLYDIIKNPVYLSFIDSNLRELFLSLKTNSYIIRKSSVDDIVAYLSGSYTNYGVTKSEQQDIESILKIYKECRDMFYAVLYNKAYGTEELYSVFVELYIRAFTIERFVSSRLDNMLNLQLMTINDCRNFLLSYGLQILSDQIDKEKFSDVLTYEKRIIANYCELMSKKGSSAVINKFFEIFNYNTTEIDIYKYLLLKDNTIKTKSEVLNGVENFYNEIESSKPKFIPVQYLSTDINLAIEENIDKAIDYEKFIEKDKYWDADELPESMVTELFDTPVTTKYLGIDLKKDIYESFIKTRYTLSLNEYLYDKLDFTSEANISDNKNIYKNLTYEMEPFGEVSIIGIYKYISLLFKLFVRYSEDRWNEINDFTSINGNNAYYGINRDTTIKSTNFNFYNKTYLTQDVLQKLFKRRYLEFVSDATGYKISTGDNGFIYFYTKSVNGAIKPYDTITTDVLQKEELGYLLFSQQNTNTLGNDFKYLLPLKLTYNKLNSVNDAAIFATSPVYDKFITNTKEVMTSTNAVNNSSLAAMEDAFESINIVNFLNTSAEDSDYYNKFNAIYNFNKFKEGNGAYPLDINEMGRFIGDETEISINNFNFYSYIYNNTLSFPMNYVNGAYNNSKEINYDINAKLILDELFEKYFTTSTDTGLGYYTKSEDGTNIRKDVEYIAKIFAITDDAYTTTPDVSSIIADKKQLILSDLAAFVSDQYKLQTGLSATALDSLLDDLSEKINVLSAELNAVLDIFNNLQIDLIFGSNISNFFDFIKTCITFFISYTSYLYQTNLIYKIDTENERVPITYKIEDQISNTLVDYFYSDETVDIIEF